MSRIGNKPITVPAGVEVKIDGTTVTVKGKSTTLTQSFDPRVEIKMDGDTITVVRSSEEKAVKSLHGLTRTLVSNMIEGVDKGFEKNLEISGVGYRAAKQGSNLVMNLGYSHQVIVPEIPGITIEVPAPNKIVVKGADKQVVGQFAAEIREKRPPEPYKGKGIKYAGEVIIRKEGKAGKGKK
ncbi:MAG: 50S ribosomal protein L6 [Angelakisella sp.]|nr:50S ribosomal protein L6 [Angelakisella sp.]